MSQHDGRRPFNSEEALKVLREKHKGDDDKLAQQIKKLAFANDDPMLMYEYGMVKLRHGDGEAADRLLSRIGATHRLRAPCFMPPLYQSAFKHGPGKAASRHRNQVAAFDDALPEAVLAALEKALEPNAAFWSYHGYPTDKFFSYNVGLAGGDEPAAKKARLAGADLIRQTAQYLLPLVCAEMKELGSINDIQSVEWWAHAREGATVGHQMHFDLDELALPEAVRHPVVSCVLYFDSEGPPTLVTNQSVNSELEASVAWQCEPKRNRLLMFNGRNLHGVVPNGVECAQPRLTLMMGFWSSVTKSPAPSAGGPFGPNMGIPAANWVKEFAALDTSAFDKPMTTTAAMISYPIRPVWRKVTDSSKPGSKKHPFSLIGGWILNHDPAELQTKLKRTPPTQESKQLAAEPGEESSEIDSEQESCDVELDEVPEIEVDEVSMEEFLKLREASQNKSVAS